LYEAKKKKDQNKNGSREYDIKNSSIGNNLIRNVAITAV